MLGGLSSGGQTAIQSSQSATAPPISPEQQGLQNAVNAFTVWNGPSMALIDQNSQQLANQIGMGQGLLAFNQGALQQDANAQLAKLNLGPEYDAIQRNANLRGIGSIQELDKLAYQALGVQAGQFDLGRKEAWQQAYTQGRNVRSDATVRGAVGGRGYKFSMDEIQRGLANQLQNIDFQAEGAKINALEGQVGRKEQIAQLEDRNKMLDIKAKEYGIDKQQIEANLQQGLAKLGIDNFMSTNQLLDALNSNDLQKQAIAQQIFRDAMEYSDFFTVNVGGGVPATPAQQAQAGNLDSWSDPGTQSAVNQLTNAMNSGGMGPLL